VARHRGSVVRLHVLTWNLFHGRDHPPEPGLDDVASRLLGQEVLGARYAQVRRSLEEEFAATLAAERWHVALLQEAPLGWLRPLCRRARASGASARTARNEGAVLRAWLAARRPDLLGSWEGGSNQVLVRAPCRIMEVRRMTLRWVPERRRMLLVRIADPAGRSVAVACLHASVSDHEPERDVSSAAAAAAAFAPAGPLILGGDLNLRPRVCPGAFARLRERHRLTGETGPEAIDHLLHRELEVLAAAREMPPSWREVERPDGRLVRLSDHAPVVARFGVR
jgi:endonuclease/exonuclease/phosphatase family metal-dependent hydrolase